MTGNLQLKVLKWLLCCSHVMISTSEVRTVVRPGHLESLTDFTYVCTTLMFLTRLCGSLQISSQKSLIELFLNYFLAKHEPFGGLEVSGKHKSRALGQWEELQNGRIQILFNSAPNPFAGKVSLWNSLQLLYVCMDMLMKVKKELAVCSPKFFLFLLEIWVPRTSSLVLIFFDLFEISSLSMWKKRSQQSSGLVYEALFDLSSWGVLLSQK